MSYIAPNTTLKILRGVPLDKDFLNTVRFTTASAQYSAFNAYTKYTLSNQSYQRANKGTIRVALAYENICDCNYLMFQNTSFENKWFFAFIDTTDYVNNNTTEITYTIDPIQSWHFDFELGDCFVEREHSLTDKVGDNVVEENLNVGELIVQNKTDYFYPRNSSQPMYQLLVFYVPNEEYITGSQSSATGYTFTTAPVVSGDSANRGSIINGIYMGCKWYGRGMWLGDDIDDTVTFINALVQKLLSINANIVTMVQVPYDLYYKWLVGGGSQYEETMTFNQSIVFHNLRHTSYFAPKNKKLLTYPYRSLVVSNNNGQSCTWRWENFKSENSYGTYKICKYTVGGVPVMSPEIMCYPVDYKGVDKYYEEGIILSDFPTPPWSEDSFAKWWAQNKEAYITSLVSTAVTTIAGIAAVGAVAGAGAGATGLTAVQSASSASKISLQSVSGAGSIAGQIGTLVTAKNTPDQMSGQVNCSSLRTVQGRIGFTLYDMGIEYEHAKIIDSYFTAYGYAVKKIKRPNLFTTNASLRPHWNYLKTNGALVHPRTNKSLPADDEEQIQKIFDKGITYWENIGEIGDYSLDNSPA